jgi:cysteine-rich repeat protein
VTSTCNCLSNYYENTTCYPCINNCTSCTYVSSNSTVICLQCNTSLNQVVNLNQTGCQCLTGYGLVNSSCIVVNPICGNGILESGESCDDDNTANGDGCSSICQIEEGCTCTYNVSIYPYSLCYFSSSVTLSTISVYKYPL